ncbi:MAG: phage tail protein [Nitrosopumilus sp.]|nr:phage tail protein [Nitrosopumilus sp.]
MSVDFPSNARRVDPYKNFRFVIIMDKEPVLGVSKVTALKRTTEALPHRSGGDNSTDGKSPGKTTYEGVTLEKGLIHSRKFEEWANKVHPYESLGEMDLAGYKKDLQLEVHNERGEAVFVYNLINCWVSEYTAIPDLDANQNGVAIESIKIELEGWSRDKDVKPPTEEEQPLIEG